MAAAGSGTGPVNLFTHDGIAYEYRESLGVGPHGESLLLARQRTHNNILEEVIVKHVARPPGEPSAQTLPGPGWRRRRSWRSTWSIAPWCACASAMRRRRGSTPCGSVSMGPRWMSW
jgi:hypothetical protein